MLKLVHVSLKLVSFAVCHGFRVIRELLGGNATNQVGNNLLLNMDFCLLVPLVVLPALGTSILALVSRLSYLVPTISVNRNMGYICACTNHLPILPLFYPTSPNLALFLQQSSLEWTKRSLGVKNTLWIKVSFFTSTSPFSYSRFHRWHCNHMQMYVQNNSPRSDLSLPVERRKPSDLDLMHLCFYYPSWNNGLMTKAGVNLVRQSQSSV